MAPAFKFKLRVPNPTLHKLYEDREQLRALALKLVMGSMNPHDEQNEKNFAAGGYKLWVKQSHEPQPLSVLIPPMLKELLELKQNNDMKKINNSINDLCDYLESKGYNSLFMLGDKGPEKLLVLLKAHLLEAITDPLTPRLPVNVDTISELPDKRGNYHRCAFEVDYNSKNLVHVIRIKLQVLNLDHQHAVYCISKSISHRTEILSKTRANKMMKKSISVKKKLLHR